MSTTKVTSADEAQRMLDDGRWDYDDSAADCARSVIDLHRQVDTARAVAANIERERHALREAYYRDTAGLRAEVRVIVDERTAWRDRVEARDEVAERLTANLSTAHGEIARLRAALTGAHAIIEGRAVAPTDAEIIAHAAAGGLWRMVADGPIRRLTGRGAPTYYEMVEGIALPALMRAYAEGSPRCWPTLNGVICAWPVIEVSHG
jgi:hypothetical protein